MLSCWESNIFSYKDNRLIHCDSLRLPSLRKMRRVNKPSDGPEPSKLKKNFKLNFRSSLLNKNVLFVAVIFFFALFSLLSPNVVVIKGKLVYPDNHETKLNGLWKVENAENFNGCVSTSYHYPKATNENNTNGYLMVELSGGLNQQRTGIIDSVVVAKILNATLIIPRFDHESYWKDQSNFEDIFDIDHFINTLKDDVSIIKNPPKFIYRGRRLTFKKTIPRRSSKEYYLREALPILKEKKILLLLKFDFRLSSQLDVDLQRLRCKVNYKALTFKEDINRMAKVIINQMRLFRKPYIALHLRFEIDMLAFSGCSYGFGRRQTNEMNEIRKRWKNLQLSSPQKERLKGKCPLTPYETGLLLRALGYSNNSLVYIASGDIYEEELSMAPLLRMFPFLLSKRSFLNPTAMAELDRKPSIASAVDFLVCADSDVFVANNRGNMAKLLAGYRRFDGHKRTITPHARKIASIMMNRNSLTWQKFSDAVNKAQIGYLGEVNEPAPSPFDFHEYPDACICQVDADEIKLARTKEREKESESMNAGDESGWSNGLDSVCDRSLDGFLKLREIARGRGMVIIDEEVDDKVDDKFDDNVDDKTLDKFDDDVDDKTVDKVDDDVDDKTLDKFDDDVDDKAVDKVDDDVDDKTVDKFVDDIDKVYDEVDDKIVNKIGGHDIKKNGELKKD